MRRLGLPVTLALLLSSCGSGHSTFAAGPKKPNVLFIIVDDLTTTLSCYGDKLAKTPHMDALAARGVRFDRAYCQFPLCSPARASFLTGCYPERTKVLSLNQSFRDALPDVVTLPELFQHAGYATGAIGKVFHGGGAKTKLDVQLGAPLGKDTAILVEAKAANDPEDKPTAKARGESYNRAYAASARPDADFTDYEIASRAMRTLEEFKDRPFMLTVGFIRPHSPYVAPQAYFDRIDAPRMTLPPFYRAAGEDLALMPKAALRPNNNVFSRQAPTPQQARDARQAYLASTAFVDAQVGRVLAKLKELHLEENTIVLLTGDHGYQLGEHGLWAKQTLFEGATHVPLIVAAPGVKPAVCAGLVEQVDILPTLAGLAGLEVPKTAQGRTLQPLLQDPSARGREVVFGTMVSTHTKLIGHSVRTERFRYIEWDEGRAGQQLYDYQTDPDELHNLADKPAQAERIAHLKSRLAAHLKAMEL
ncbi:MAG: sulfatase [Opitutaceae bacterium]|nr:sulfatase [Opitutaceae bacterium]